MSKFKLTRTEDTKTKITSKRQAEEDICSMSVRQQITIQSIRVTVRTQ